MKSSSAEQATPAPLARCPWCGEKDAEIRRLKQALAGRGEQAKVNALLAERRAPGKVIMGRQGMDGVIHGAWCQCIACRAAVE